MREKCGEAASCRFEREEDEAAGSRFSTAMMAKYDAIWPTVTTKFDFNCVAYLILPPVAAKLWPEAYIMKVPCKTKVEIADCKAFLCAEPTNLSINFGVNRKLSKEFSVEYWMSI